MCILSYLGPNVPVDEEGLLNGGLSNPDGHGWAITDQRNGRIVIGKSMDLLEALDGFIAARKDLPDGYALFHSRWATHGTLDTSNVHPFVAGHSEQTVVAHNGILPREAHPAKGDSRSDTRLFADEILSTRYRRLNRERVREALAGWITTANKLVILTVDPRYRHNAYLINSGQGHWDKQTGIWHSNYDFESAPRWLGKQSYSYSSHGGYSNGYWQDPKTLGTPQKAITRSAAGTVKDLRERVADIAAADRYADLCCYCDGEVTAGNICTVCATCQDCLEIQSDCLCFSRMVTREAAARLEQERWYETEWGDDDAPMWSGSGDAPIVST